MTYLAKNILLKGIILKSFHTFAPILEIKDTSKDLKNTYENTKNVQQRYHRPQYLHCPDEGKCLIGLRASNALLQPLTGNSRQLEPHPQQPHNDRQKGNASAQL